ncbi:MAG: hypothetical protein ACRC2K_00080 [Clostridium sp.]
MSLDEELKLEYELEKAICEQVDLVRLNEKSGRLFLRDVLNEGVLFFMMELIKNYIISLKYFL